jgi:hypothetical protein
MRGQAGDATSSRNRYIVMGKIWNKFSHRQTITIAIVGTIICLTVFDSHICWGTLTKGTNTEINRQDAPLRSIRLPDHECLGVDLSLRETLTFDQRLHLRLCLEAELLIEPQGLGCRLEESLTALLICPLTAVSEQHAASALSLVFYRRSDDLEICDTSVHK